ncbi:FxSxx-COOH system tetratricopeptide repeat protein [Streptomyces sp. NPDC091215]|uniref:FxSxx-COOH system tetratricopeptide repeat protein n=1 Tax=Streptomyces sp. NPDC091215 TaxID=3155192 RepID=UPI0034207B7D
MSGTEDRPDSGDHDHVDFRGSENYGPQQGKGTQNNYYGISRIPATLPHQVGVIPSRAGCFQDRAEAARLRQALAAGGTTIVGSAGGVLAGGLLAGMGGVGKTQLAADYARTVWQAGELDVLVWINASNDTEAASGYAQAGIEILGVEPEQAAKAFLACLEPGPRERSWRWLVVLDDVADPADLNGLWPPASPHGRTLVTTRRKDAALTNEGRRLIEVGLFTEDESVDYLTAALATRDRIEPAGQLAALADGLGHLPLALSQAAAYLIDTGMDCASYRALLADRATKLADTSPDALPDGQTHTAAAAWAVSIERVNSLKPAGLARPLLQLAAFLDPNGIPDTVLTSPPAITHLTTAAGRVHDQVTPDEARRALRALYRLSLIDHTPATPHQAVRVHQLVQRTVRDALTPAQHDQIARTAADALFDAWPGIENDTALAQALRANTTALTALAENTLFLPKAHAVLYRAGSSLGEAGQVTAARDYFHHLTRTTTFWLGPDHPDTLSTRHSLARWRGEMGDPVGAAAAFAELLDDCMRVLGPDDPDTLTTRHNLARWRGAAGDPVGAAAAFTELLDDHMRVLGPDHPDTLTTRHNLAHWRGEAGDLAGAAAGFAELLDDCMRVLGPDDPDTLTTRNNLARWRGETGDLAGAAAAVAELLNDHMRVLGPDHPHTLTTRHNLARWRGEAGDPVGAAAGFAELLKDRLRVLGPDHPDTLTTRHNLAHWQGEAGDPVGADAAFAELLDDYLRVLGPDHPDTLTTRNNIAHWRGVAGDPVGAAAGYGELLDDYLRVLGPDHPHTLITRNSLARWRGVAGDPVGAAAAFAELLKDRLRVLGLDHPDTLSARHNLASWRGAAGDPVGADAAFAELLDDYLRVLGPDHPHTLITRNSLARWRGEAGDLVGAAAGFAELLKDRLRVLGADHPDTLTTRHNLAYWQRMAEEGGEGEASVG